MVKIVDISPSRGAKTHSQSRSFLFFSIWILPIVKYIFDELTLIFSDQDCRNNPGICHSKASCKNTGIKANKKDGWTRYQCQCKKGYIGTGFVCVKQSKIPKKKRKLIPNLKDMF